MLILNEFEKKWAFLHDKKVFLACSGGVDSMVLLFLLQKFCKNLSVLHVNYQLRGKDSNEDENFVRAYCLQNKLPFLCKKVDLADDLKKNKGNLQEKARKIRYDWFNEFLKEENTFLILGQHFDDQMETFYQHLARKSGVLGMACMLEIDKQKIRPLLAYRKAQIISFAKENKLLWREDSSNASIKYTRNKWRNKFLPYLETQMDDLAESIQILVSTFQENYREIEETISLLKNKILSTKQLKEEDWELLNDEQKIVLLKSFNFKHTQLAEIDSLFKGQKGKVVLSKTHKLIKEENFIGVNLLQTEQKLPEILIENCKELPKNYSKSTIYLDKNKLHGELKIRFWEKGDRMFPIGMLGSKLISDIITDAKIPNHLRSSVCVLHDKNTIHWCVGLKIGKKALASEESREIIKVSLLEGKD